MEAHHQVLLHTLQVVGAVIKAESDSVQSFSEVDLYCICHPLVDHAQKGVIASFVAHKEHYCLALQRTFQLTPICVP